MKTKAIHSVILTLFLAAVFLNSCSDSTPEINTIQTSVVFDFADETSAPSQRLSLFLQTDEVNRVEKIQAEHVQSGLEWNIFEIKKISSGDSKKWAGYTKLVPASGSAIPVGTYTVKYTDAADNKCESTFSISYQTDFVEKTASDFPDAIEGSFANYVAIYAADGTLIGYEKNKKKWTSFDSLKKEIPIAEKVRKCYVINNGAVIIMMPFETKINKQMENESE